MKNKTIIQQKQHTYLNGRFEVVDYSVSRHLDDDEAYADLDVWKSLPRGKAEVYALSPSTKSKTLVHTLVGMHKFGDEDQSFGFNRKEWTTCIATDKANGECFHLSFFEHEQEVFCILGSKRVHIILDLQQSIVEQVTQIHQEQGERVSYASKMALFVFSKYPMTSSSVMQHSIEFILEHKVTFVGEYINPLHEHIVSYEEEMLHMFAICHPSHYYCWCPPLEAKAIFTRLTLPTVDMQLITNEQDLQQTKQTYFDKSNSEGLVLYYVYDQPTNHVANIHKYKNKQYTILRTIREYFNSGASVGKLRQRLRSYHIPLTNEEINDFVNFFLWLKCFKSRDDIYSTECWNDYIASSKQVPIKTHKLVILMVGIPGSGKTTIGSQLLYHCLQHNMQAHYIDQDHCFSNFQLLQKQFHECLHMPTNKVDGKLESNTSNDLQHVIIHGKSNFTQKMRQDTLSQLTTEQLLVVNFERDVQVSLERINNRSYHPTIHADDTQKAQTVVQSFYDSYETPTVEEFEQDYIGFLGIVNLPCSSTILEKVNMVIDKCNCTLFEPITKLSSFQYCNYIGLAIESSLKQFLPVEYTTSACMKEQRRAGQLHVTLLHQTEFRECNISLMEYLWDMLQQEELNKPMKVELIGFGFTNDVSAFFVRVPTLEKVDQSRLHITWQKTKHAAAVDAKFIREQSDHTFIPFEPCIEIEGTLKMFC